MEEHATGGKPLLQTAHTPPSILADEAPQCEQETRRRQHLDGPANHLLGKQSVKAVGVASMEDCPVSTTGASQELLCGQQLEKVAQGTHTVRGSLGTPGS